MSPLLEFREKLNLTQEELAAKSGVSVRTIQRIESGITPKGYTLKALSKALEISKSDLLKENVEPEKINKQILKYINLSAVVVMIIPLGSILVPLIIMRWKKEFNTVTKQIVSIQILWSIAFPVVMLFVNIIGDWFGVNNEIVPIGVLILILINLYIILRNAIEIEKNTKLFIKFKFSII
jgi:transcriptional regulator with XRE-family HTH domain